MNDENSIKNFFKHKIAAASFCILLLEIIVLFLIPIFLHLTPNAVDNTSFFQAPSSKYLLGTDEVGHDVFARILYGGQITLMIGVSATMISVLIGLPLGLAAGYYRGWREVIIMRCADIFLSFPSMVLILVAVAVFGSTIPLIIFLIGFLHWPAIAKLIYGNALSVSQMEYVEAERAIGRNSLKILFSTVLPNAVTPLWVALAFRISSAMMTESALSFLGAGVQPPQASWGNIIQGATSLAVLTQRWWIWVPAGLCLIITVVCINFIGEGVRDALDPKMKRI
jgi:peptide/nickel transport system permease protein